MTVPALVHEPFEAQAAATPDATAVVGHDGSLTYAELNDRSNRLAAHLQDLGVGPEVPVGICVERSLEMTVAFLATFKAGGACVPLDPAYPTDRLAFMLADAGVEVVLTQERLTGVLPPHDGPTVLLDNEPSVLGTRTPGGVTPENLAYVIYTSGSTGEPKGVMLHHRGLLSHNLAAARIYDLGPDDRVLQFCSISFDVSVEEMLPTWAVGGTVVLRPDHLAILGRGWLEWLRAERVSVVNLPTAYWHEWVRDLDALDEKLPESLRVCVVGGEKARGSALEGWNRVGGGRVRWFNAYAPNEASVMATSYEAPADKGLDGRDPPIGRPLPHAAVHVLGPDGEPVPAGQPGELYIGGAGVARGYRNRPELTAERFLPDPFSDQPGARVYRTGDLVAKDPDGDLEFIGRLDEQVKVRGFRIETAEVEATLARHPGVVEAVVTVREDTPGDRRLVAYVLPSPAIDGLDPESFAAQRVAEWEGLYDRAQADPTSDDPAFDLAGWVSSYTGEPIPAEEMAEWVDTTVHAIRELEPSRVLELGCGTGLLLWRIAPHCGAYVGSDVSGTTLARLARRLEDSGLDHVRLLHSEASDFSQVQPGEFDTIVANSVVEAFPSLDYLEQVLAEGLRAVGPGGRLFLGNVRSLPLLDAFYASVELARNPSLSGAALQQRVERRRAQEIELVVDPAYFVAWGRNTPGVAHVEVQVKRARHRNELSSFRYDVAVHVGDAGSVVEPPKWWHWREDGLDLTRLRTRLSDSETAIAGVAGVPNSRVAREVRLLRALGGADPRSASIGQLSNAAAAGAGGQEVDPEHLWALGEELGFDVRCSWGSADPEGAFDAAFLSRRMFGAGGARPRVAFPGPKWTPPRDASATDPLAGRVAGQSRPELARDLRRHAQESLPPYMVPAAFVTVDHFPLTPNGKVDRVALPAPGASRPEAAGALVPPTTATEETLAAIWSEVLGVDQVGIDDDFFELGGDSLLGTQVIVRVREALGVEVPLRALFDRLTIRGLARMADEQPQSATPAVPLEPVERDGDLALSFAQERLWFLDQLVPDNPFYNVPAAYRLRGPLDVKALARALDEVLARQEALRTTFPAVDGRPRQRIHAPAPAGLEVHDLRDRSPEEAEAAARAMAAEDATRPFDLARGPLLRAWLVRLADDHHVLGITMHHIVSDGWSVPVLLSELRELYQSLLRGEEPALAPLPVQYADYAAWHRRWLDQGVLDAQLRYWTERLAGAPPILELPTDRPRPPMPSFVGASHPFEVDGRTGRALQAVAHQHGASLFMVVLTALDVVLGRHAGTDDVVVGTPVAGRVRPELERLVGFFVNTLVLRTDLSGDPTFAEALARVRDTTLGAFDHQDLPFERLVLELDPVRDLSRNPLVQVLFQMGPEQRADQRLGPDVEMADLGGLSGGAFGEVGGAGAIAPFDLDLFMAESPEGHLTGLFVYATDLFEARTVARLTGHLLTVLEAAAGDPARPLSELPFLTEEEERRLLAWGGATPPASDERCLHQLVEEQVRRTPNALAVVNEEGSLTYADLDDQADRLARRLAGAGVGPDVAVGMCVERSLEMAVAVLAILKAGGAVLPLDPAYPDERLAFMVSDSATPVVVASERTRARVPVGPELLLLGAETRRNQRVSAPRSEGRVAAGVGADNLAYVIYTSGSTGVPRGVMLTHRGLVSENSATVALYGLQPDDRVLQFCSISFDISVEELFTTWASGATVVLRPDDLAILGRGWLEWLRAQDVTVMNLPTAYWHEWVRDLRTLGEPLPPALRLTIAGGEKALGATHRGWLELGGDRVRWLNAYGPTETSVMATAYEPGPAVEGGPDDPGDPPIGRPLANTTVRVLDERGRLVPVGVPGELHIGGAGLARGYLGRPELTATQFIPDPWARAALQSGEHRVRAPGARLYRSGDLVRFRPDGELEFLERRDEQVKVRGFRIETGEVQSAILAHPDVDESVVVAREEAPGDKRLVAYLVPRAGAPLSTADVREFLASRLPAYMVPTAFVALDALPLTPNGKLDRDALPRPAPARPELTSQWVAARTPVEAATAAIWASVLGVDGVGVDDDFFELGGHSLLATQVIAQIRETFGIDLPLRELFEAPTVAGLAAAVEARGASGEIRERPARPAPLQREPRQPEARIPLGLAQEQMWRLEVNAVPQGLYNITALHRFGGRVDGDALRRALELITERHEILRTSFPADAAGPYQRIAPAVSVELPHTDLTVHPKGPSGPTERAQEPAREDELQRLVAAQDGEPFDLSSPPLLRARLFDLGDSGVLAITLDHLVCDGTSAYILLGEVAAAYEAVAGGRRPDLPPLEIQFADFALWQRRRVTEERLRAELEYWTRKLAGMPLGPAVPFDHAPERPARRIVHRTMAVEPSTYARLERLARSTQSTMFVVCVAAVSAASSRAGGLSDIVLSTTLSGRGRQELEGVIGMFAGMSRLRTDLSGDPTFVEVMARARETVLGMFENQDVPFMEVRRVLVPDFPTDPVEVAAALPNELAYFRVARGDGAPGAEIVERPADELFFRGQHHPLSFTFLDDGDRLWMEVSYKVDYYDESTIDALVLGLGRLLSAVGDDPGLRLSALPAGAVVR